MDARRCVCKIDRRAADRQYVYCSSIASVRRCRPTTAAERTMSVGQRKCCCTAPIVNTSTIVSLGVPLQRNRSGRGRILIQGGKFVLCLATTAAARCRKRMLMMISTTIRMSWLDTREIFGRLSASTSMAFETRLMDRLCLCLAASLSIPVDVTAKHIHAGRYRDHPFSRDSRRLSKHMQTTERDN